MQSRKWTNHPKFAIETALAGGSPAVKREEEEDWGT
jgi:hypothetical protein